MSPGQVIRVPAATLRGLAADCFQRLGLAADDASTVADVLIDANLRGISSHGFQRVPIYAQRLRLGLAGGSSQMSVVTSAGCLCRLDAGKGLGPSVAVKATDKAISLAGEFGIGLVALGSSTHFGPAGYYARRASSRGLIAIVMTNAPKTMAPHGAAERFLGTNPLAIAIPLGCHDDFVLDMATSSVARGKIIQKAQANESIPPGLAIDAQGRPTTDADAALAGSVLPFAGPKGSGLALAVSMLSGALAQAEFDDELASMYEDFDRPQDVGQVFLVIDPWRLGDRESIMKRLDSLIDRLTALAPAEGHDAVRYPGQPEAALEREQRLHGIRIDQAELLAFAQTCTEYGLGDLAQVAHSLVTRKEPGQCA